MKCNLKAKYWREDACSIRGSWRNWRCNTHPTLSSLFDLTLKICDYKKYTRKSAIWAFMITVNAKIKSTCPTGDFTVTCCIGISNGLRVSSLILFTNICMKNARNYFNTFSILLFQNANYDMVVTQIEQCVVSPLDTFVKSYQSLLASLREFYFLWQLVVHSDDYLILEISMSLMDYSYECLIVNKICVFSILTLLTCQWWSMQIPQVDEKVLMWHLNLSLFLRLEWL